MATVISVDPAQPLDLIGRQIIAMAGITAYLPRLVHIYGRNGALALIMAYLTQEGIQVVDSDGAPYAPADAIRCLLSLVS